MKELSLKEILTISIRIASCIEDIHQQRIIHKDINPAHILVHPETYEVKLINFGLATRRYQEHQGVMN